MSGPNTKYELAKDFYGIGYVTKNGHTMTLQDIVADLSRLTYLEGKILESTK